MVNVENETIGGESEWALLLWVLEELKDLRNALIKQQELIYKLEREEVKVEKELERVIEQAANYNTQHDHDSTSRK